MGYRFGSCEIRLQSRELFVDGQPRSVEPQVFDLLCLLAREADRVISHDELIAEIWGGRIISDSAISARISAARRAIGDDGASQRYIRTVPRRGFRLVCAVDEVGAERNSDSGVAATVEQQVRFTRSADGTRIAYAETGSGYPLVRAGHWLTHLEYDWHSPIWRPLLDRLSRDFRVVRYDQRGNGLSDWDPPEYSLERFVDDLAAVVDAASPERVALYGTSQGAAVAIAYTCRFPDRISHLILQGGYEAGRLIRSSVSERSEGEALMTLLRQGWGKPESAFLKMFSAMFIPDGTKEEIDAVAELQRMTTTAENALRIREAVDRFDVRHLLANVAPPTLVLHARNDSVHPMDQGRKLAAGIRGARFIMLESANHVILPHEPAWEVMLSAIHDFVRAPRRVTPA
jgi:pimeloyl-ACP methyl ester carboxylesterase/DNA-binding winged helix-turn-helix (wHTH) protein